MGPAGRVYPPVTLGLQAGCPGRALVFAPLGWTVVPSVRGQQSQPHSKRADHCLHLAQKVRWPPVRPRPSTLCPHCQYLESLFDVEKLYHYFLILSINRLV